MVVTISCCYFLEASPKLVLFPGGFSEVGIISWRLLGSCWYFLEASGEFLLFPGGF